MRYGKVVIEFYFNGSYDIVASVSITCMPHTLTHAVVQFLDNIDKNLERKFCKYFLLE